VTLLWTWEASAPGTAAVGVSEDMAQARRAASRWMCAHRANARMIEEVRLAVGVRGLLPLHERTGVALRARRDRKGRVRWQPEPAGRAR
jgi:hypothetical protein